MPLTNNAEAGPSITSARRSSANKPAQPKVELAKKVERYNTTLLEDCLDYSLLISNNISEARDQLMNERNWLTWLRLSCTLIILGFTILLKFRLPDENDDSPQTDATNRPVGYVFVAIGLICFFVGLGKYFKNQRLLAKQATYVEAGWGSYTAVGILFVFVCTVMILASLNAS